MLVLVSKSWWGESVQPPEIPLSHGNRAWETRFYISHYDWGFTTFTNLKITERLLLTSFISENTNPSDNAMLEVFWDKKKKKRSYAEKKEATQETDS